MAQSPVDTSPERDPTAIAPLSQADESFMQWFEEDAPLNDFANARAEEVCATWHGMLAEAKLPPGTGVNSPLHFAIKKWLFLFTNPRDHTDTPDDRELGMLFVNVFALAGKRMDDVPATLGRLADLADTVFMPRLANGPVIVWNELSCREKFWLVQGALLATADSSGPAAAIPAQPRRS